MSRRAMTAAVFIIFVYTVYIIYCRGFTAAAAVGIHSVYVLLLYLHTYNTIYLSWPSVSYA